MFNLIVSTGVQSDTSGTILATRVFEYTDDALKNRFMPNGTLNVSDIMSFPTIFMQEGFDDEVAGVGWLSRLELQGRDYQLHFTLDADVPRLTNKAVHEMASDLRMDEWEFSRNHWAIKDVDLFRILYKKRWESARHLACFR